VHHHTNQIN